MYLVENKKPIELVQELKDEYKIPSFEEFMKDYQIDEKVNYDDLNSSSIGEEKGYEPCTSSYCTHSRSELQGWLSFTTGFMGGAGTHDAINPARTSITKKMKYLIERCEGREDIYYPNGY